HLCRPGRTGTPLRAACERLGRVAHLLAKALLEPPDRILVAVRQAAGVHGALVAAPARREAVRVPSFDAETARRPARKRARAAR
ncbi:MAG TPA: hypothetical protein VFO85_19300, partial [Vicinamibacteria bacterium]|nr:hypothetical protein [Vicinamibacteria bacterium]